MGHHSQSFAVAVEELQLRQVRDSQIAAIADLGSERSKDLRPGANCSDRSQFENCSVAFDCYRSRKSIVAVSRDWKQCYHSR